MYERTRIVHLTSAHDRTDTRIFQKMCLSAVRSNFDVTLVVADGKGNDVVEGVEILDVGKAQGRRDRMIRTTAKIFKVAINIKCGIYHIHDPELMLVGLKLKNSNKKVVFDSHEDVPLQILSKIYFGKLTRLMVSALFSRFERWVCSRFDGVISATPTIRKKFDLINRNSIDVNNYPKESEFVSNEVNNVKFREVCYVGGLATVRGVEEIVDAIGCAYSGVRLNLAGNFFESSLQFRLENSEGWKRVNFLGFLGRSGVRDVLNKSLAGLVTLHPIPNYIDSLPVKMFEYMAAGIPVIASHFPLWREIVEGNDCGLCVDPLDPAAIARAIDYLATHPKEAERMGRNGQRAVQEKYNWGIEEAKLLQFYSDLAAKVEF